MPSIFLPARRGAPFLALLVIDVAVGLVFGWFAQDANAPPRTHADDISLFMRAKLVSSQKVMEGLVTEQFSLIEQGSADMLKMSQATHWPKSSDEVYKHYSDLFRKQSQKLVDQARRRDLQASHYTYLHMTTTCIDCHNYVRGRFRVEQDDNNRQGPIQLIPTEWEGPTKREQNARKQNNMLRVGHQRQN